MQSSPASINAAQQAHLHEHGYVAVPDFLAPGEVAALQAEVERLQTAGSLRNVATIGDGKTISQTVFNLQICPAAPVSPLIRALPYAPKVVAAVEQFLGGPALFHLDQIFLKPAQHGAGTNWHTDYAYWPDLAHGAVGFGMWIAVHAATVANGTMQVIPRGHLRPWAHQRDPASDHHITCAPVIDEQQAVPIELPAGGALFFYFGVPHRTTGNRTDRARAGLAYHFLREDFATPEVAARYYPSAAQIAQSYPPGLRRLRDSRTTWGEDLSGAFARLVS